MLAAGAQKANLTAASGRIKELEAPALLGRLKRRLVMIQVDQRVKVHAYSLTFCLPVLFIVL